MRLTARFFPFALTVALMGTLSVPNVADAVSGQLKARIAGAKDDVKESKKLLKDDKKDLRSITKLAEKWTSARDSGNTDKMARIDEDLLDWLREELSENREDRTRARVELESTGAEVNPQPVRTRRGRPVSTGPQDNARQADARSDLEAEREDARNTREVAEALREVQRRYAVGTAGPRVHTEKLQLLSDLVRSARRDYRRSTRELAEDEDRLDQLKARR
ncbi:MAG: hypothetical protein ACJAZO_001148 [Myxococcota bacterium]|jgi:hypothetical protein